MKRMHIHISVSNLEENIRFYSALFASEPTVQQDDYAKWMLDDPCVNFAISARGIEPGLDHLGIQVDSDAELQSIYDRLDAAGEEMLSQEATTCCYARSNKHWITDPQGLPWETFHTLGSAPTFGADRETSSEETACCAPEVPPATSRICCGTGTA